MSHSAIRASHRSVRCLSYLLTLLLSIPAIAAPFAYVGDTSAPRLDVIDMATDTLVTTITTPNSTAGVGVSPDGTKVYAGPSLTGAISFIDGTTNSLVTSFASSNGSVSAFAFKSDGSVVYATFNANGTDLVYVIDTTMNTVIQSIVVPDDPTGIVISPDDSTLYVSHDVSTNQITIIDTATNTVTGSIPASMRDQYGALRITLDGGKLYTTDVNNSIVIVIDTVTQAVSSIAVAFGPAGLALTPDGTKLYVSHVNNATTEIIDTTTDTVVGFVTGLQLGTISAGIAISPDGTKGYTSRAFQGIEIFSTATNTLASNIPVFFFTGKIGVPQLLGTTGPPTGPPQAICQDVTIILDAAGQATLAAAQVDDGSTAEAGLQSLALDQTSFSCADLGTAQVTLTVTDLNTDTDQCTANVLVENAGTCPELKNFVYDELCDGTTELTTLVELIAAIDDLIVQFLGGGTICDATVAECRTQIHTEIGVLP